MKFLRKVCASLLVLVITTTVSVYVLEGTLLNAHYLETKASSTHLINSVSQALPTAVASGNSSEDLATQQTLASIVTPAYIQTKLNPFLDQLQAYYVSNGPTPQLDLTDLVAEAQRQGIQVPPDSTITKPIVFKDPTHLKSTFQVLNWIKLGGPIVGLLLLAGLMFMYHGWHRFTAVTKVCLSAAFSEGVIFALFKFAPNLLDSLSKSNANANPLVPVIVDFFKAVLADVGNDFGKAAIGLVAVGILALGVGFALKAAGLVEHHTAKAKAKEGVAFIRPNSDNRPPLT